MAGAAGRRHNGTNELTPLHMDHASVLLFLFSVIHSLGSLTSTDQWGVMHDGKTAYPGAVECINRLGQAGKKVVRVRGKDCHQLGLFSLRSRFSFMNPEDRMAYLDTQQ